MNARHSRYSLIIPNYLLPISPSDGEFPLLSLKFHCRTEGSLSMSLPPHKKNRQKNHPKRISQRHGWKERGIALISCSSRQIDPVLKCWWDPGFFLDPYPLFSRTGGGGSSGIWMGMYYILFPSICLICLNDPGEVFRAEIVFVFNLFLMYLRSISWWVGMLLLGFLESLNV